MEQAISAQSDRFVHDRLPPPEQWPQLVFDLPELHYLPTSLDIESMQVQGVYVFAGGVDENVEAAVAADATSGNLVFTTGRHSDSPEYLGGFTDRAGNSVQRRCATIACRLHQQPRHACTDHGGQFALDGGHPVVVQHLPGVPVHQLPCPFLAEEATGGLAQ